MPINRFDANLAQAHWAYESSVYHIFSIKIAHIFIDVNIFDFFC